MNIGIVLVTFNRLNELKKTVRLYEQQTKLPAYILVVDNHSTDGTHEFLSDWVREESAVPHRLITLPVNSGGSGGFYAGTEQALTLDAEWIWLADDDAYPDLQALEILEKFSEEHPDLMQKVSSLCTQNISKDQIASSHRSRIVRTAIGPQAIPVPDEDYAKEYIPIDVYSFVGAVLRKDALQKAGLPNKDFFIYMDDMEHALRMRKQGDILCVPAAKVFHTDNSNQSAEASWRDYYATRNLLLTYKWHFGFFWFLLKIAGRLLAAFSSRNPAKIKVFAAGILDALTGKLGLHAVYKPGWKQK